MNIFFYFSYHRKGSRLYVLFCTEKSFKRINRIKIILSFDLDILFRAVLHDVRLVVTMQGIMCPCSHIQMPYNTLQKSCNRLFFLIHFSEFILRNHFNQVHINVHKHIHYVICVKSKNRSTFRDKP